MYSDGMGVKRKLPFDPIDEARRHWEGRWGRGDAMAAATGVMRVQQIVLGAVDEVLRPFDLTFARYEALVLLQFSRKGSLPLGKMGERLMIHPTSVTNIVDRLEAQGFLRRVPHPPTAAPPWPRSPTRAARSSRRRPGRSPKLPSPWTACRSGSSSS